LPDRNSLALVIKDWLHWFGRNGFARADSQRMRIDREPHIGEYANHATPKKTKQTKGFIKTAPASSCPSGVNEAGSGLDIDTPVTHGCSRRVRGVA
jgi:hypothetical protein